MSAQLNCSLCDNEGGQFRMVAGKTGLRICSSCITQAGHALKKDDFEKGDYPMPITEPVQWAWTSSNVVSIYAPSEDVDGGRIYLQLWSDQEDGSFAYDSKLQMEATAAFVCECINRGLAL